MPKKIKENFEDDLIKEIVVKEKQKLLAEATGHRKLQVTIPTKLFLEIRIWALARNLSLAKALEIIFDSAKNNRNL